MGEDGFDDYCDAMDGDDLQNFSDQQAWEDSQADMADGYQDEEDEGQEDEGQEDGE